MRAKRRGFATQSSRVPVASLQTAMLRKSKEARSGVRPIYNLEIYGHACCTRFRESSFRTVNARAASHRANCHAKHRIAA